MTNTECITCQINHKMERGEEVTQQERNHWTLWGCTCEPQAEAEAIEWMDLVTR